MRGFGTRTRIVLAGVIGLILCGYGWWFLAPGKMMAPDLEADISSVSYIEPGPDGARELEALPIYVASSGDWLVGGKRMRSLAPLVRPDKPEPERVDGILISIGIRLPSGADRATMQQALGALASEGICRVAVVEGVATNDNVVRIRRFTDANGVKRICQDRFSPGLAR